MFSTDVSEIQARLTRHGIKTIGHFEGDLLW